MQATNSIAIKTSELLEVLSTMSEGGRKEMKGALNSLGAAVDETEF